MSTDIDVLDALCDPANFDIAEELTDMRFYGRQHYNKGLYSEGCRGPLCRKRERDEARRARENLAIAEGRIYTPGLRRPRVEDRDDLLNAVYAWHLEQLKIVRARKRADAHDRRIRHKIDALIGRATQLEDQLKGTV